MIVQKNKIKRYVKQNKNIEIFDKVKKKLKKKDRKRKRVYYKLKRFT